MEDGCRLRLDVFSHTELMQITFAAAAKLPWTDSTYERLGATPSMTQAFRTLRAELRIATPKLVLLPPLVR